MNYTLKNDFIHIIIDTVGAELCSIKTANGREYLWQGDPAVWGRRAPVLFPIVGKLKNNTYFYNETEYNLPQHGFARDLDFKLEEQAADKLVFSLTENENTLKVYPFQFKLLISYQLIGSSVSVGYEVQNTSNLGTLLFSIGGHPAFNILEEEGVNLYDYHLEFEKEEYLHNHPLKGGLIKKQPSASPLMVGTKLPLNKQLYANDALVFSGLKSKWVALVCEKLNYRVQMSISEFPWFGTWGKDDVPFVCLEPWCGHADFEDHDLNFQIKDEIVQLAPKNNFKRSYQITLQ
jgi:galactose mutarotase-like enzyme